MAFESEFLELMPHTIEVFSAVGVTDTDDPVYATTAKRYRCRIAGKGIALRKQFSEDNTVIYDIWLYPIPIGGGTEAKITTDDKIVLPEEFAWIDDTPEIFSVGKYDDEEGPHHIKIQCGWMYHRQGQ